MYAGLSRGQRKQGGDGRVGQTPFLRGGGCVGVEETTCYPQYFFNRDNLLQSYTYLNVIKTVVEGPIFTSCKPIFSKIIGALL